MQRFAAIIKYKRKKLFFFNAWLELVKLKRKKNYRSWNFISSNKVIPSYCCSVWINLSNKIIKFSGILRGAKYLPNFCNLLFNTDAPFVKTELGRNLDHSTIKEGVDVYFDCIINANPPAKKIYWTHNVSISILSVSLCKVTRILSKKVKSVNFG